MESEQQNFTRLRELFGRPLSEENSERTDSPHGQRYLIRVTQFKLPRELLEPKEIEPHIDGRDLLQLLDEKDTLLGQIVARAACGDECAIELLLAIARGAIEGLSCLEELQPQKLRAIAETSPNWPVLLSLNPQDARHVEDHLKSLNVGAKAATPRRPEQRLDPQSFWTQLAEQTFKSCRDTRTILPVLRAHCTGTKPVCKDLSFWGTSMRGSFYDVSPTDCILITDWEERCAKLSLPVSRENFKPWWDVIKHCVLEFWNHVPSEYERALKEIGYVKSEEKQYVRRNMAVDRLEQAFRSLVNVQ